MRLRSHARALAALAALLLSPFAVRGDDPAAAAAKAAAERDARALGWLLQQGVRALAAPVNNPQAADQQQRQQIEQHAKQLERMFQPVLNSELELIRRCCGGLAPAAGRRGPRLHRAAVQRPARSR